MAYADQDQSSRRAISIGIVILLHALLGYAFITGLAQSVIKKTAEELNVIDIEEPPPPPEEPPPPPPEKTVEVPPPPVVSPPPIVRTPTVIAPPVVSVPKAPPVIQTPTAPIVAPAPPAPPAVPVVSKAAKARGNPGAWTSDSDYPAAALRNEEQGTVGFRLDIGADGRVTGCTVTQSSGSSSLDETTCRLLPRRAKFSPAQDNTGNPIATTYSSRIKWVIPE
jgi:protein TonB